MSTAATPVAKRDTRMPMPKSWLGKQLRIAVIGLGGSGSETVDALARLDHVLRSRRTKGLLIDLIDGDTVSPSNVIRQRFVASDVGQNKAKALAERYGYFTGTEFRYIPKFIDSKRSMYSLKWYDLVITCVDRASVRVKLAKYFSTRSPNTLWLDMGNGSHTGQVVLGQLGRLPPGFLPDDCPRVPHVVDLFPELKTAKDDDEPSCSLEAALRSQRLGVNRFMADVAIFTILAPMLMTGHADSHGAQIDMSRPFIVGMKVDPAAWARQGYKPPRRRTPASESRRA